MKILVTGSSGLIGTALVKDLQKTGIQVTKLLRQGTLHSETVCVGILFQEKST